MLEGADKDPNLVSFSGNTESMLSTGRFGLPWLWGFEFSNSYKATVSSA